MLLFVSGIKIISYKSTDGTCRLPVVCQNISAPFCLSFSFYNNKSPEVNPEPRGVASGCQSSTRTASASRFRLRMRVCCRRRAAFKVTSASSYFNIFISPAGILTFECVACVHSLVFGCCQTLSLLATVLALSDCPLSKSKLNDLPLSQACN